MCPKIAQQYNQYRVPGITRQPVDDTALVQKPPFKTTKPKNVEPPTSATPCPPTSTIR